ncbi:MAG: DUF5107 domain-containing protein [Clostridia bacterium]|nr:DUF5107 domain-containing protein [Clostridia bacterium]
MSSVLTMTTMKMDAAQMRGESSLPAISGFSGVWEENGMSGLGEDEGLFIGYGMIPTIFPYRMQDLYTRELYKTDIRVAILENEYLKAVFYPDYGGKLASLYDKERGRNLLYANTVVRPCNLALRNAWMSGGIEYNCGPYGHHPFTCSTLHTAKTALEDGTPVLRFYEFERVRKMIYQLDFFLPERSKVLFARIRLTNTNVRVTPAYWWSNMAVYEAKGSRTIVPADSAYSNVNGKVGLVPIPVYNGTDVTYATNNPIATDFFFKLDENKRRYETQVDREGYGMIQTSTSRLIGRKLFVWGQGPGGDRWQKFLTADDSTDRYVEIQAGLAHSQFEHLPMPPRTTWEWLEAYGAIQTDPKKTHGDWKDAKEEVERCLDELIPQQQMDSILARTKGMATSPAKKVCIRGSGFGALEVKRRKAENEEIMCAHLDFGSTDEAEELWDALLDGTAKDKAWDISKAPASWMLEPYWIKKMRKALDGTENADLGALLALQIGVAELVSGRTDEAKQMLEKSIVYRPSPWALYGLSRCAGVQKDAEGEAQYIKRAVEMDPEDVNLSREALIVMAGHGMFREMLAVYDKMPQKVRKDGRVSINYLRALIECGELEKAEKLLLGNGGLVIPDIREGETSLTNLWYLLQEKKAQKEGRTFDRDAVTPPESLDFRMSAAKK